MRVEQVLAKGVVQGETYAHAEALPEAGAKPAEIKTVAALLDVPEGSYYVPLSQPLASLVVAALEPDTTGQLLRRRRDRRTWASRPA